MTKHIFYTASLLVIGGLSLGACSGTKETLGLNKAIPDEFKVVRHAPLEMPPNYALRPPEPGMARPQEQEMAEHAAQTVFGGSASTTPPAYSSDAADTLLQQAGAHNLDPEIRQKIDGERRELNDTNKTVAKKLLNIGSDDVGATIVDAEKEAERIKNNQETGKDITEGEVPSIDE